MEKHFLVVDSPTSANTKYFERLFANSSYDCRIVTTREELTPLLTNLRFTYIFIGDVDDISWLPMYKYAESAYIVFYSMNSELVEKQRQSAHESSIIPIKMMDRFLTGMGVIYTKPNRVDPSLLF